MSLASHIAVGFVVAGLITIGAIALLVAIVLRFFESVIR